MVVDTKTSVIGDLQVQNNNTPISITENIATILQNRSILSPFAFPNISNQITCVVPKEVKSASER